MSGFLDYIIPSFPILLFLLFTIDILWRQHSVKKGWIDLDVIKGLFGFPLLSFFAWLSSYYTSWAGWILGVISIILAVENQKHVFVQSNTDNQRNIEAITQNIRSLCVSLVFIFEILVIVFLLFHCIESVKTLLSL